MAAMLQVDWLTMRPGCSPSAVRLLEEIDAFRDGRGLMG
jgi:hypothetical protein